MARRGALVPPKIDDPMEPTNDPLDEGVEVGGHCCEATSNGDFVNHTNSPTSRTFPAPRRSSVVVIPPMQVCPGDLLVYSKALTHRGNFPGTLQFPNEISCLRKILSFLQKIGKSH